MDQHVDIDGRRRVRLVGQPVPSIDEWRPAVVGLVAAVVLFAATATAVLFLASRNADGQDELLRHQIRTLATAAAQAVDGDLHRAIHTAAQTGSPAYRLALEPLVRLHRASPDIQSLYTMVDVAGVGHYVLDTAADPILGAARARPAARVMQPSGRQDPALLAAVRAGRAFADVTPRSDDDGTYVTGAAPIHDAAGAFVGWLGVDFRLDYTAAPARAIRDATVLALAIGAALAVIIGLFVWRADTEVLAHKAALERMATTDPLTGAPNRRHFANLAAQELARLKRYGGSGALLMLDIDHFKRVNDEHGHAAGDRALRALSREVQAALREADNLGRLGGEEFAALLPETELQGAIETAERLRAAAANLTVRGGGGFFKMTISVGVTLLWADDRRIDQALARADNALYRAKEGGRDRVEVEEPPVGVQTAVPTEPMVAAE